METGLYFISTITTNYITITTFQFAENSALSAKVARCQKCIDCFNENNFFHCR